MEKETKENDGREKRKEMFENVMTVFKMLLS
jgi:hypothetical protein